MSQTYVFARNAPGAEYDRDPGKIEMQARLIASSPRLLALHGLRLHGRAEAGREYAKAYADNLGELKDLQTRREQLERAGAESHPHHPVLSRTARVGHQRNLPPDLRVLE